MSDTNFQPIFDYIDQTKSNLRAEMPTKAGMERILEVANKYINLFQS